MTNGKVIVIGNEKGGTGKSTISVHMAVYYMLSGKKVATIDLDGRQGTLTRYIENRIAFRKNNHSNLCIPEHLVVTPSPIVDAEIVNEDEMHLTEEIQNLRHEYDFIIIDTPGTFNYLSTAGHNNADILITPINDSLIDLDVLAHVDVETRHIKEPSHYAELVWDIKKYRSQKRMSALKWFIVRNRLSFLKSKNRKLIDSLLDELAPRLDFKIVPGLSERIIYREMFLDGLTLFDLNSLDESFEMSLSHVSAKNELHQMFSQLNIN
jgi:chromosome partitioning protein